MYGQVQRKWNYGYNLVRVFVNFWDYSFPATIMFGQECTYTTNKSLPKAYNRCVFLVHSLELSCMHMR